MTTVASNDPRILTVEVTEDLITAQLADGRTISVPLAWSWRLSNATPEQHQHFEIIGTGQGVHWRTLMRTSVLSVCSPARLLLDRSKRSYDQELRRQEGSGGQIQSQGSVVGDRRDRDHPDGRQYPAGAHRAHGWNHHTPCPRLTPRCHLDQRGL